MPKNKPIDIKKPGGFSFKKQGVILLGMAIVLSAVFGIRYYNKKSDHESEEKRDRIIIAAGIDKDFFVREEPAVSEPEPELEPDPLPPPLPPKKKPVLVIEAPKPPPPPPPPPPPENLFKMVSRTATANTNEKIINFKRRGAVQINVKNPKPVKNENVINEVKGKWNEDKTKASLPIDMSRVLTMDRFISAILVPEIDSSLAGKVTAQVEQNVYGAHGRKILIPAGTKAIGRYKPLGKVGEERLSVIWFRMITPDGINIHCGKAEMADTMGRSGITGEVDNKYFDRYGMSLLVSLFSASTAYSIPVRNDSQQIVIESFGKEQSSLAKTILEEQLEIRPKITIPYGSRIIISPSKDIWFKKLKGNEIVVVPTEVSHGKN